MKDSIKIYQYNINADGSSSIIEWDATKGKKKYVLTNEFLQGNVGCEGLNVSKHLPIDDLGVITANDYSGKVYVTNKEGIEDYKDLIIDKIIEANQKEIDKYQENINKLTESKRRTDKDLEGNDD